MTACKKILFYLLFGLFSFLAATETRAAAPAWKLLPSAQVNGDGIFLDQVALISGLATVPHLLLARAPQAGQTNILPRSEVAGLAMAAGYDLSLTEWNGALEVRVVRRQKTFAEADLLELLTAKLQEDYARNRGELELHLTRPWEKPVLPDEPLKLKIVEMPVLGIAPNFIVTFALYAGKERVGTWQLPVQAALWNSIPIARSTLARGESLQEADITMERADLLVQRDVFLNFPTRDDTLQLTENVPAGRPILNRFVHPRPLLLRGQMVEAVFQEGSLGISLLVEALEDGTLGQTVRVRNPKTKRELHGKVESEKTIRIIL